MAGPDAGGRRSPFKAYDIRGRVPEDLDSAMAWRIGQALDEELAPGPVITGRDVRSSSPVWREALSAGRAGRGRTVIDLGLCGTEEVYFATSNMGAAGGVMVTASHNPLGYNGMKLVREDAKPISGDSGLDRIRQKAGVEDGRPARLFNGDVDASWSAGKSAYAEHLLNYVDADKLKPLKIVANAGNGTAGLAIDALAPHLPFEFVCIQHEPDPSFPHGIPNPLLPEMRQATVDAVRDSGADIGLAWDGDFDRCFFFDADGRFIEGYYVVGLLAEAMLQVSPGGKVIHDPRLVWNTIEKVTNAGGIPVESKTGHAFIKERMRREDAIYGGEMSAHHYFRDFAYCDSGMIPWLLIASLISTRGTGLADMVDEAMERYPCSGELNFMVNDPQWAIQAICDQYQERDPQISQIDGLSADFGEWRYNLRISNTEPLLRLNIETRGNAGLLEDRINEISEILVALA